MTCDIDPKNGGFFCQGRHGLGDPRPDLLSAVQQSRTVVLSLKTTPGLSCVTGLDVEQYFDANVSLQSSAYATSLALPKVF